MRWPGRARAGRVEPRPVSLVDLAPTFLAAAGVGVPAAMTGESLGPLLGDPAGAPSRGAVVLGRERHTVAQKEGDGGYPMRALRTERWLYIRNLEPDRWPAGWEAPGARPFRDCDNGPTKSFLLEHRDAHAEAFALCFGRRPAEELYDVKRDPFQLTNLAAEARHAEALEGLRARLDARLERLADPRTEGGTEGGAEVFDEGTYRGSRR